MSFNRIVTRDTAGRIALTISYRSSISDIVENPRFFLQGLFFIIREKKRQIFNHHALDE
jgi:hypothetical protein